MNARSIKKRSTFWLLFCAISTVALAQRPGDPPQQLTIEQAVQIALERNLQIALARSSVETSEARVTGAFGTFLPTVSVSGGYTKQLTAGETVVIGGVPISTNRPDNVVSASASTSLVLFDGFGNSASYGAARHGYNSAVESLAHTRSQIEFNARQAYLTALRSQQIVDVRRSDLEVARDRLERIKGMVEVGTGLESQVYSQEAEVANRELELEQSLTDALVARNNLSVIMNADPGADVQLSAVGLADAIDDAEMASTRARFGTLEQMLNSQRDTRRDLAALRLDIEAADASIEASRSGFWPTVSTSLGYDWSRSAGRDPSGNAALSLDLRYSPFDGFRTSEQVELAQARKLQAEVEYQAKVADVRSRLRNVLARLDGAERQIRAAGKALAAARQNRFSSDERYRLGAGTEADYILANSQYLTAQINQINAVFNYRQVVYELKYELGQ